MTISIGNLMGLVTSTHSLQGIVVFLKVSSRSSTKVTDEQSYHQSIFQKRIIVSFPHFLTSLEVSVIL